jgi:arylsulfatase A-like enzyme
VLAWYGCRPPQPAHPNLLWIVSDTLRADALSCYGGLADTPNLCALAARGALFERAYSNAAWTLPSSVSMFSSMYSSVFARVVERPDGRKPRVYHIPDEQWLFGESLAAAGYEVLAFIENALAGQSNTLQGFSKLEGVNMTSDELAAIRAKTGINTRDARYRHLLPVLRFLLEPTSMPFALLLWIDDPHAVYSPPEWLRDRAGIDTRKLPRPVEFYLGLGHVDRPEERLEKLKGYAKGLSIEEAAFLKELYHLEVESVDERIGAVLAALEQGGGLANTVVAFTSDHGESFREHRGFLHGISYYEEQIRVPLIFAGPSVEPGRRFAQPVVHVDLAPTLAELLGVTWGEGTQGKSYASTLRSPETPSATRSAYIVGVQGKRFDDALVDGRYKLIERRKGIVELFDVVADPAELTDLSAAQPEVVKRMQSALAVFRRRNAELNRLNAAKLYGEDAQKFVDETEAMLRSLGYVE